MVDVTTTASKNEHQTKKPKDYERVDLNCLEHEDVRGLGAEWLCRQSFDKLGLTNFLTHEAGFSELSANMAQMHIISRAVFPASEHKTAQKIKNNSAVSGLFRVPMNKVNRFKLYSLSNQLYEHKSKIENYLSGKTNELFDLEDKIIFYDLTNTYFEGSKANSKVVKFGKSKEKRSDAKIVALATVVNAEGFVKYSHIYQGNMSDSKTLGDTIKKLSRRASSTTRKPLIVMDAGIITEDNAKMLKEKGYDYICVSRTKLKNYNQIKAEEKLLWYIKKETIPLS